LPWQLTEQLADAGVTDEEIAGAGDLQGLMKLLGGKETAAARVVRRVLEAGVELFHDVDDVAFSTVEVGGHAETWSVRSRQFGLYVRRLMHSADDAGGGEAVNSNALADAVATLEARALFDGEVLPVHVRVAGDALRIVIDLGDPEWRAVEITRDGWRVLDRHPVKFRRTGAQMPLPVPVPGGSLEDLRNLLNAGLRARS
jgi:putative DNA primase/helicase